MSNNNALATLGKSAGYFGSHCVCRQREKKCKSCHVTDPGMTYAASRTDIHASMPNQIETWKTAPPFAFAWISSDLNKDNIAISSSPLSSISPS